MQSFGGSVPDTDGIPSRRLTGRWGSDAKRYIQEARRMQVQLASPILARQPPTRSPTKGFIYDPGRSPGLPSTPILSDQPHDQVGHVPAVPETCIDNSRWVTLCGWNYGTSIFRKQVTKPKEHYCAKCSLLACHKDIDIDSEDDM